LVTGWLVEGPGSSLDVTKVLRNDGLVNGEWEFVDINAGLPGRHYSDVMWADYDNDGYLDITLTGSAGLDNIGYVGFGVYTGSIIGAATGTTIALGSGLTMQEKE